MMTEGFPDKKQPKPKVAKASFMGASCLIALVAATPAFSQAAPADQTAPASQAAPQSDETTPEIVVQGYRSSIQSALDAKRKDIRITDGISAEDIGKLPAENITEAIQRISGVQMSNINGRGSTISIRGLGAQYSNTTINGQSFASADYTTGFRFDIIQTDVASSIEVIKSPIASMDAGGLSGTININTVKPLEYKGGNNFVATAKINDSSFRGGAPGFKFGGTYIDSFANDTFGVMLNAGYQKLRDRADYAYMDRYQLSTVTNGGSSYQLYTPQVLRYRRFDRDVNQVSLNGVLQWRPSPAFEASLSGIYSRDVTDMNVLQQVFGMYVEPGGASVNSANIDYHDDGTATVSKYSVFNAYRDNNTQVEKRRLQTQAYTGTLKWSPSEAFRLTGIGHFTKGTAYQREDAAIMTVHDQSNTTLDITDPDNISLSFDRPLTDTSLYTNAAQILWNEYPDGATRRSAFTERAGQLDATYDVGALGFKSLSLGVKYRHETMVHNEWRHDRGSVDLADMSVLPNFATTSTIVSNFLNGSQDVADTWAAINPQAYKDALAARGIVQPEVYSPAKSYSVDRFIPSAYLMGAVDTQLFGRPLRGNIGVRYERTKQDVKGFVTNGGGDDSVATGTYTQSQRYDNWLPSASFALDVSDKFVVRAALAKVLVRPLLNSSTSMAYTVESTFDPVRNRTAYTIDLGQAGVKPLTANQADLSFEYYYGRGNSISFAGFYKAIKNGSYSAIICPASFQGVGLTYNAGNDECLAADGSSYDITATYNDPSVLKVKGLELAWSQSLDSILPLNGFGFTGNVTRVWAKPPAIGTGYRIRNLSNWTGNFTGYYELGRVSLRASVNYRSKFEQDFSDSFFARQGHTVTDHFQVDLAGSFKVTESVSLNAGVLNLNQSSESAYRDNADRWQASSFFGRTLYASVTAKF